MDQATLQDLLKGLEVHGLTEPGGCFRPRADDMLTATELAARLKQAARTVERWHRKGVILGIKVDGALMFYWPSVVARLVEKYQERERPSGEPIKDLKDGKGPKQDGPGARPALPKLPSAVPGSPGVRPVPAVPMATGKGGAATAKRPK